MCCRKRHLICHSNKLMSCITKIMTVTYPFILTPNHRKPQQPEEESDERLTSTRWDDPVDTVSVQGVHVCFEFRPVHDIQHFFDTFAEYIEDLFCILSRGKTDWIGRFDELRESFFPTFYFFCNDAPTRWGFEDPVSKSYNLIPYRREIVEREYGMRGGNGGGRDIG